MQKRRRTSRGGVIAIAAIAVIFGLSASTANADGAWPISRGVEKTPFGSAKMQRVNIFSKDGRDPRVRIDRSDPSVSQFAPIGLAVANREIVGLNGVNSIATSNAIVVSPCFAIVDYHGVYGKGLEPGRSYIDYSMTIYLGSGELKHGFRWALRMMPVPIKKPQSNGRNGIVLMQMEKCAGQKVGWMDLYIPGRESLVGMKVDMAAYHGDLPPDKIVFQKGCHVRGSSSSGMVTHDCATRAGASGGALVTRGRNGNWVLIATNWGAGVEVSSILTDFNGTSANIGVPVDSMKETSEVIDIISKDIKEFGRQNAAAPQAYSVDIYKAVKDLT